MREVPEHTVNEFAARRSRFCVIIPVLNEGERIRNQLHRMASQISEYDTIIADGNSNDGSLSTEFLRTTGVRTLLVKTGAGALSAQIRMGLSYAMDQGYEGFILIDGNNKDNPDAIARFAQLLDEGFDHIQGSRFIKGGKMINNPLSRVLGIRLLHAPAISLAARVRYTDTTNGFRAYSRKFLQDPRVLPFRSVFSKYELHYYLAIRAGQLGFKVTETPVERAYPSAGPTPTKIKGFRGNFAILKTLSDACLGKFNPEAKT